MTASELTYTVAAFNIAAASENKIHDDTVASRFGFTGGLVPGVAVFGYMAHLPVAHWGREWLEHGTADCRFDKPVYDGASTRASASIDGQTMRIEVHSGNTLCALGSAALPPAGPPPSLTAFPTRALPLERPPADETTLAEGTVLCTETYRLDRSEAAQWHLDLRETDPLYEREQRLHPASLLRLANWTLTQNVRLGPWIHIASKLRNFASLPVGATLEARGIVTRNYEQRGHRIVDIDLLVLIDGERVAARIAHSAIYRPRQVVQAGG